MPPGTATRPHDAARRSTPGRARATSIVRASRALRVLVVGDVMLDRFIVGRVTRISPEAPVPVVQFAVRARPARRRGQRRAQHRGARRRASLVGLVGADAAAARLRGSSPRRASAADGLVEDPARPTTEKVRVVTERNQQVARIDYERTRTRPAPSNAAIVDRVAPLARGAKALLVSDYLKGAITRPVVEALLACRAEASAARPAVIVDPKIPHLACYAGATLITPNHQEAEMATHCRIRSDEDARDAAQKFRARAAVRRGADHARRARHVAVDAGGGGIDSRGRRARCRT